jgi:PAS domain S-box-containing protein
MKKYSEDAVAPIKKVEKLRLEPEQCRREPDDCHQRLEMLEGMFAQVEDAVFVVEPDGQIVDANSAAGQMLGYEKQELLGRHLWEFVAGGSRAEILGLTGRLVPGMPVTIQRTCECKDGTQKVVDPFRPPWS